MSINIDPGGSIGKIILLPKGNYNSSTIYNHLDWVRSNGKAWVCKVDGTQNIYPTEGVNWTLLAQDVYSDIDWDSLGNKPFDNIDNDTLKVNPVTHELYVDNITTELSKLDDVNIDNPEDKQVLTWDNTSQKWVNKNGSSKDGKANSSDVNANWQGNGYNLIPFPYNDGNKVTNGITYTVNSDGSVTANGTATATAFFAIALASQYTLKQGTTYVISNGGSTKVKMYIQKSSGDFASITDGKPKKFTVNDTWKSIGLYVSSGTILTNEEIVKPMLVEVNDDGTYPTEYQRYAMGNVELTDELNNKISISDIINYVYPVGSIYMSVNNVSPQTFIGGTWEKIEDKFLLSSSSTHAAGSTGGAETHTITTNEMPTHTHTFTGSAVDSGNNSVGHTHSGTTENQSVGHTHSIPALSGTAASNGAHAHSAKFTSAQLANGSNKAFFNSDGDKNSSIINSNGAHTHTVTTTASTTGGISANHTHSFTTGEISANHTHSVTAAGTNSNAGNGNAMSIMPPYLAVYMWKRTA